MQFKQKNFLLLWALVASSGATAALFPGSVKLFKGVIHLCCVVTKTLSAVLTCDVCLALCPTAVK